MSSTTLNKVEINGASVQLFEDDVTGHVTGFRYSTGTYYHDPLSLLPKGYKTTKFTKTKEEIDEEIKDITSYPTRGVSSRDLKQYALDRFSVKTGLSEADGETVTTLHFPYRRGGVVVGYKTKLLNPKRYWGVGVTNDVDLFGWEEALNSGSPKLFITEGEADAVATYQMLKDKAQGTKWDYLEPAVVSIPNGAAGAKQSIAKAMASISAHFKDVVLVFDMDEAGKKAAKDVIRIFPTATVATLPAKDPNACLMEGRQKAFCTSILFKAAVPKNTRLVRGSSLREAARQKAEWGLSYPWQELTDLTRGRRRGETIYWGAGVKMGKSELVNALAEHIIVEHDSPVLLIKPEEAMVKSYQMLVGKAAGKIFHDPKVEFDFEAYDRNEKLVGDKAIIVDSYQFIDWDTLKGDIRYAVVNDGVKDVIIDPITALTNQVGVSEANEFLVAMTAELSAMAKDLDFTADIFCHLKAPQQGDPHERGGHVLSTQFAGSRAMMRSCNYMIGLEGNKNPELELEERNMRKLVLLEDREFGNSGVVSLYWDHNTGLFNEVKT